MTDVDVRARLQTALHGRYTLEHELGSGGMAIVYAAQDVRHHRRVALKVVREDLAAGVGAERFLREIKLAASLHHPNILPLYDSGEAAGILFYVMPLAEGESLRHRLNRDRTLPMDEAIRFTCEVADALDYAHRHGVIHRDIKPDNILLHEGHALVTDFGIGRALSSASAGETLTQLSVAIGTPAYMSPEQASGESSLDGRTDLYSLGCVLYEMLAGAPPFEGPTAVAVIAKRLTAPPPDLASATRHVTTHVSAITRRLMATDPAERFATGADVSHALAGAGMPTVATPMDSGSVREESRIPRIAVLSLAHSGRDPELTDVAEGLVDEITTGLARFAHLRVVARQSGQGTGQSHADLREVGKVLGARFLLDGSIRKSGSAIRVGAKLVDVTTGTSLWAETYDRDASAGIFAIQDDLAAFSSLADRALSMNPRNTGIGAILAMLVAFSGDWERGYDLIRRFMALNPYHPGWFHFVPFYYHFRNRNYADALASAKRINMPDFPWTHSAIACASAELGKWDEARAAIQVLRDRFPWVLDGDPEKVGRWFKDDELRARRLESFRKAIAGPPETAGRAKSIAVLPFTNMSGSPEDEYFSDGISEEIINDYAAAQAALGEAIALLGHYGLSDPRTVMPRAKALLEDAIARDGSSAEAHSALALVTLVWDRDRERAELLWKKAIALNPRSAPVRAIYAAWYLCFTRGRFQDADAELVEAVKLDPLNAYVRATKAVGMHASLRPEAIETAVADATRAVELDPNAFLSHWSLQMSLNAARRWKDAVSAGEAAQALSRRHPWALFGLIVSLVALDRHAEARALYDEMRDRSTREYVPLAIVGSSALYLGRIDEGVSYFWQALERRETNVISVLPWYPFVGPLRELPDYPKLLAAIGWDRP